MNYYVRRVCKKGTLMLMLDLESEYFDFSFELTMFFRTNHDLLEMYHLCHKYMITGQTIDKQQIFTLYEYLRTHDTKDGEQT